MHNQPSGGLEISHDSAFNHGRAAFPGQFLAAVRRRDASAVREFALQAGTEEWAEASRPLADLLDPPSSKWRTPRSRKRGWSEARAAAVWALGQINSPSTYPTIARTLICDPSAQVRTAAAAAVGALGDSIIPCLVETLRGPDDWELEGMRALVASLGDARHAVDKTRREAGMALTSVLYENLPAAPKRWARPAKKLGRTAAMLVMATSFIASQIYGLPIFPILVYAWIAGQCVGLAIRGFVSLVVGAGYRSTERDRLADIAAQSLIRLDDKRAIPGMVQLAFDSPLRNSGFYARNVLQALLPQVTSDDAPLFNATVIEYLNCAIGLRLDQNLTLAMLHTLEVVGDGTSIRRVQRLTRRGSSAEIRTMATQVLQVLEARAARLRMSRDLLRGSQAAVASPEEMLRAATSHPATPDEQLLRATQGEQSP